MKLDINEELVIECIKNYYRNVDQKGRIESFENDLKNYVGNVLVADFPLSASVIQIVNGEHDNIGDKYYDGILAIPYRFWLVNSPSRFAKSEIKLLDEQKPFK